ncbi:hypothetical protein [Peribacillus muralis]|uniref:hypothetical protein n=1 Tax=Peribacillus muralis TaxID=264697 RepID=UPI000A97C2B8|nr:hypothetical protein [Peribacillus muralis]
MSKKRIFKKTLALMLSKKGHKVLHIESNKFHPDKMVYVFKDTFQFQEDLHLINKNCQ